MVEWMVMKEVAGKEVLMDGKQAAKLAVTRAALLAQTSAGWLDSE